MPQTRVTIVTPPLNWSKDKLRMARRDILVEMARFGAPNCQWIEQDLAVDASHPQKLPSPPEILYVHLKCMDCSVHWYAETFTPCRACGKRESVRKATIKKVPLPGGLSPDVVMPVISQAS